MNFIWNEKEVIYTIKLKSNVELFPHLGYCNNDDKIIVVSDDLSPSVFKFVLAHELMHIGFDFKNATKFGILLEEFTASLSAFMSHPIGGIKVVISTLLTWDRIKLYIDRFKKGK